MSRYKFPETGGVDPLETIIGRDRAAKKKDEPQETSCKYCKQKWLHWENRGGSLRLVDRDGDVHTCEEYRKFAAAKLSKEFSENE